MQTPLPPGLAESLPKVISQLMPADYNCYAVTELKATVHTSYLAGINAGHSDMVNPMIAIAIVALVLGAIIGRISAPPSRRDAQPASRALSQGA